ncbi:MAG: prephenate dehydrogenase/arogenate dehydrogenase family protein [Acidobacteriota bacterium]
MSLPARIGISGLGLVGGSIARALAERAGCALHGADPDPATRELARASGIFARVGERAADVARDVDLLVLAGPIPAILGDLAFLAGHDGPALDVTDVGSTKQEIATMAKALPRAIRFVGGHPIAGSERSGFAASDARLFEGATWALCPPPPGVVPASISALVALVGARSVLFRPGDHDRIVAATSHLPQLLAVALGNMLADLERTVPGASALAGGGFRDLTRIAASSPALWESILASNRVHVDRAAQALGAKIEELAAGPLAPAFGRAAEIRSRIVARTLDDLPREPGAPVRVLGAAELPAVLDLWTAAGLAVRHTGRDTLPSLTAEVAEGRGILLGSFDGGTLVSAVLASSDGRKGWINRLAVRPSHRRRGLGSDLIGACERLFHARRMGLSCAFVENGNDESLALFQKMGYVVRPLRYMRKPLMGEDW